MSYEEDLWKNHKNSLASGGSAPEPPRRVEFSIPIIFLPKFAQKIHEIYEK